MSVIHAFSRLAGISLIVQTGAAHAMAASELTLAEAKRQSLSLQRHHANAATVGTRGVYETPARFATRLGASQQTPSASTARISYLGHRRLWPSNLWRPKTTIRKEADMIHISFPIISSSDRSSGDGHCVIRGIEPASTVKCFAHGGFALGYAGSSRQTRDTKHQEMFHENTFYVPGGTRLGRCRHGHHYRGGGLSDDIDYGSGPDGSVFPGPRQANEQTGSRKHLRLLACSMPI